LIQSIFISRDSNGCGGLIEFCNQHQLDLVAQSLISFEPSHFVVLDSYDVIFFSSIRSAEYFLTKEKLNTSVKIACIGQETALKLKNLGMHVDFVGENSGNPSDVSREFKNWIGTRKVLIPHSSESLLSITEFLNQDQTLLVEVYKTQLKPSKIAVCDCYVFTSPTNVRAFLLANDISSLINVIAWGRSTEKELLLNKIPVMNVLQTGTMLELESYLKTII
jgi:uroporphyrinogen-III synthase